jgi:hypothetical protein
MAFKNEQAQREYTRRYNEAHREELRQKGILYRKNNRERIAQRSLERYQRDNNEYKQKTKEYRDRHREEIHALEESRNSVGRAIPVGNSYYYDLCFSNLDSYRQWIAGEVAEDSKRLSPIGTRRAPLGLFPISHRRWPLYRRLLDAVLGERCRACGFAGRLELAHLAYFGDSVPAKDKSGTFKRVIEALEHPDRFVRLCSVCHDIFDHSRRCGGRDFLKRIETLIISAEDAERASRTFSIQAG